MASGRCSADRGAGHRGLWVAAVLFGLFVLWTVAVRVSIADGSRESAWIIRPFGDWPHTVDRVDGTSDIQFSVVANRELAQVSGRSDGTGAVMAGRPTVGTLVDSFDSDNINGSRFVTDVRAGPVGSLSIYVAAPVDQAPNDRFEVAVYDDRHGAPHRRLAVSERGTLQADSWNTVSIDTTLRPDTAYWFFYNTNGTSGAVNNAVYSEVPTTPLDAMVRSVRSTSLLGAADLVAALGGQGLTTVVLVALAALVARRRWPAAVVYLAGFALSLGVALALRTLVFDPFGRYPSGHVLRAAYVVIIAGAFTRRRAFDLVGGLVVSAIVVASIYNFGHAADESLGGLLLAGAAAATALSVAPMPTPTYPGTRGDDRPPRS